MAPSPLAVRVTEELVPVPVTSSPNAIDEPEAVMEIESPEITAPELEVRLLPALMFTVFELPVPVTVPPRDTDPFVAVMVTWLAETLPPELDVKSLSPVRLAMREENPPVDVTVRSPP